MQQSQAELRQVHEQTILARLRGDNPVDFGKKGAVDLFATAVSAQPEFQPESRTVNPEMQQQEVRRKIDAFLAKKDSPEIPANREAISNILTTVSSGEKWNIYLRDRGIGADTRYPPGLARIEIELETEALRQYGQSGQYQKWEEEHERIKARIEEVRQRIG